MPVKSKVYNAEVQREMIHLWETCVITDPDRFKDPLRKALEHRETYRVLASIVNSGMPWWFIAALHMRESYFSFSKHLHNGDPLTSKTVNVPKDQPPGNLPFTFEYSAYHALIIEGKEYDKVTNWSLPHILWLIECWNGLGPRLYHNINTGFNWAGSSHYKSGKYISDGKWSPTTVDKQPGTAGLIKLLGIHL